MRKLCTLLLLVSLGTILFTDRALVAAEAVSPIGRQVASFDLKDFRGKDYSLEDFNDSKVLVVVFLGTECPLAKLYAPRLTELAAEFADRGVAFVGMNSNRQDSNTKMMYYARAHDLNFPLLKDLGNVVADQMGARRTPEAFVLDQQRVIRYRGRIDDQFGVGYQRPEPTRRDLAEAIEEVLAGKEVTKAETDAPGCIIGRIREANENAEVTYSNQIARIFQNHCVECHREGEVAPFSLTSYDEVVGWAEMIAEVVEEQRMPPWHADPSYGHFANDIRLSDEDKQAIFDWVAAGAPEGDPSQLPPPREFVEGWQLPREPDAVIYMNDDGFTVPADGVVDYQYFVVDPGFTEDKWVKVAECVPDNRRVVHHIIVFIRPPEGAGQAAGVRGMNFLAGFAPGTRPFVYPDGMAKKIPAGSKLVFQMHYTPVGTVEQDRCAIGLIFVDNPDEVKYQVATVGASNHLFEIPPYEENYVLHSSAKFRKGGLLLSLFPHMHLRGKSFRYELIQEDGTKEILLDVPRYDFNWQNHFIFAEPIELPPNSKLFCTAVYDNSENNPANPDPSAAVRWGDQTWEEMMIGWYDLAIPVEAISAGDFDTGTREEEERQRRRRARRAQQESPEAGD